MTAGELANLLGPATAVWHLSVVNSTDTATARLNQSSFTFPLAELTIDTTSGNWSSVSAGNTVAIGATPGGSDKGLYRIRKTPSSTALYIGETAEGDPGLITMSVRTGSFSDNDYVTVYLHRRDIWSVIPRIVLPNSIYEDFDALPGQLNTYPPPIVNILINGTDRWAGMVDVGQVYRTVTLSGSISNWPTSTGQVTYTYAAPAGWGAPTAGSLTGSSSAFAIPDVTWHVPASATNYEVSLTIVDEHSNTLTVYRQVWAHDTGSNAPIAISDFSSPPTWDRTGMKVTISLHDNLLASVPVGAMVNVWGEFTWNGADIATAATQFVGWVIRQSEISDPGLREAQLEIVGPAGLLALRGAYSQFMDNVSDPATWQYVNPALAYVDFLIYWCLAHRAKNIIECFNYTKLGISNLTGRIPAWKIDASGNLLAQVQTIAQAYSANVGCNPDGEIMVRQHPNLVQYGSRSSIPERLTLNETRLTHNQIERSLFGSVRSVRGEAFYWDGTSTLPTPVLSDAPGTAPAQNGRDDRLQGQCVDSQVYLNWLTGLYFAQQNNPLAQVDSSIGHAWPFIYPAELSFVDLSIPAEVHPSGALQAFRAIPISTGFTATGDGTYGMNLSSEGETTSTSGVTYTPPSQSTTPPPYVPPPNPIPTPQPTGHDGGTVIVADATHLAISSDWFSTSPTWTACTGTGLSGSFLLLYLDPLSPYIAVGTGNLGAWMLTSSALYYTTNILTASPTWTLKFTPTGYTPANGYDLKPSISASGVIYIGWVENTHNFIYVARLSNYGSTTDWITSNGIGANNVYCSIDIDNYGGDEVLVGTRYPGAVLGIGGTNTNGIYRVVGGTPTLLWSFGNNGSYVYFMQKPLKTFAGASNSSTGSAENILTLKRATSGGDNMHPFKTTNGFSTQTDIQPVGMNKWVPVRSVIAVDNANVIAIPDDNGVLWVTQNGGTSWTSFTSTNYVGKTLGYFPRKQNGNYGLYSASSTKLGYSPNLGTTWQDKTGNYGTAIGTVGLWNSVIPIW